MKARELKEWLEKVPEDTTVYFGTGYKAFSYGIVEIVSLMYEHSSPTPPLVILNCKGNIGTRNWVGDSAGSNNEK